MGGGFCSSLFLSRHWVGVDGWGREIGGVIFGG